MLKLNLHVHAARMRIRKARSKIKSRQVRLHHGQLCQRRRQNQARKQGSGTPRQVQRRSSPRQVPTPPIVDCTFASTFKLFQKQVASTMRMKFTTGIQASSRCPARSDAHVIGAPVRGWRPCRMRSSRRLTSRATALLHCPMSLDPARSRPYAPQRLQNKRGPAFMR